MPADHLVFPPFRLDLLNERLWCDTEVVPLPAKPFAVLRYLVEHPGRLVTRAELSKAVWSDTIVSESVLRRYIHILRGMLEDNAEVPRFIETVPRRGYRFIAPLHPAPPGARDWGLGTSPPSLQAPSLKPQVPRIVGREEELAQLHGWLDKALRGERQIVFVTGEAGIGKTTIVEAFLEQVGEGPRACPIPGQPQGVAPTIRQPDMWLGRGQCIEHYGAGEAYLPVLGALGQIGRAAGGERFITLLQQHAPIWLVQMPGFLSTVEWEALQRRVAGATHERMLREMTEAVEVLTAERGLVLWLEDLQWSDYSTVEWLAAVAQQRSPARLLVLGTYRPADVSFHKHPLRAVKQELLAHGQCEELWLPFLTPEEVAQYVAVRYPHHHFPPELGRVLHRRTEGNPLFMVNTVEYLAAQGVIREVAGQWQLRAGVEEIPRTVPESLRQLIEKHIERLNEEQQRVLEVASVVGNEFAAAVVAAGMDATVEQVEEWCEGLVRRGHFLRAVGSETLPDGTVTARYSFLHALYQTVLYERVSETRRMRLHQRAGESEERMYGSRAGEIAAELAVHFEQGRDYRRAIQYLEQAGGKALQRSANAEAINLLSKALELLKTLPETPEHTSRELSVQGGLGLAFVMSKGYTAPEVEKVCARTRALCQQIGETPEVCAASFRLYQFYLTRGELHTARELGEQLLRIAQRGPSPALLSAAHAALSFVLRALGEFPAAQEHAVQGIACYDPQQHGSLGVVYGDDPKGLCLLVQAWTLQVRGYPDQAQASIQECLTVAQSLAHPFAQNGALTAAAILHQVRRARAAVQESAETIIASATKEGFPYWIALGTVLQGWALAQQGQAETGIAQIRQALTTLQTMGVGLWRPRFLGLLAEACGKAGQANEGLVVLAEALELAHKTGEREYEAELYRLTGELSLTPRSLEFKSKKQKATSKVSNPQSAIHDPQLEEAEDCFHQAIEIARQQSAKLFELRAAMSLSRLWQQQGKRKQARQLLMEIYNWFTEGFDTVDLQEAKGLLAELHRTS